MAKRLACAVPGRIEWQKLPRVYPKVAVHSERHLKLSVEYSR